MDIISTILTLIAGFFVAFVIISTILLVLTILLLIYLYKQAKKHPKGVLISLIAIIILSLLWIGISWATIISAIEGISTLLGSLGVLVSRWKYLKGAFK